MRDIKFRLWDISNEIMYSKVLVGNYPDTVPMVWCEYEGKTDWFHIEPKVCKVMQYTGLKDIGNIEIYEGDIIQEQKHNRIFVVIFKDGMFKVRDKQCPDGMSLVTVVNSRCRSKIIGNIYLNDYIVR